MTSAPSKPTLPIAALVALCLCTYVSVTNASMSSLVLPALQEDFGVFDDELSWFVVAYLVPFAIGTVIFGRLADIYGTRRLFLGGMVLFVTGTLLVAVSPSFGMAVSARVLQGFGGTAVPALGLTTIIRVYEEPMRSRAVGATVVAVGAGFGTGPLLGGTLTDAFGWPGPFFVTGAVAGTLTLFLIWGLPNLKGDRSGRFDVAGAILLSLAVTGLLFAINRLPNDVSDRIGLTGAIAFVPLMVLFGLRIRGATHPFIDPRLLRNRRYMMLCAIGFCIQGSHFAMVVLLPLLLQRYHDLRVFEIGLRLLPGALVLGIMGFAASYIVRRTGPQAPLVVGSWLIFNAATAFVLVSAGWSPAWLAATYAVVGGGYGLVNSTVIPAATEGLPEDRVGVGVGMFTLLFFLGGAAAVAAQGAILRLRADTTDGWLAQFEGATEFSDAGVVVLVLSGIGFVLSMLLRAKEQEAQVEEPGGPPSWIGRQKPNRGGSR